MIENKAEEIKKDYETNSWLIKQLTDGISDTEALLQLPFPANCMNWILGHIITSRNVALQLLGAEPIWGEQVVAVYRSGSAPITDGTGARQLADLLADIEETKRRIVESVETCAPKTLEKVAQTDRGARPVWQHIQGLHWHETYHAGQLEILRAHALALR